jgi:hypothetical protein
VGRTRRRETYADESVVTRELVLYSDGGTQAFVSRLSVGGMIEILE